MSYGDEFEAWGRVSIGSNLLLVSIAHSCHPLYSLQLATLNSSFFFLSVFCTSSNVVLCFILGGAFSGFSVRQSFCCWCCAWVCTLSIFVRRLRARMPRVDTGAFFLSLTILTVMLPYHIRRIQRVSDWYWNSSKKNVMVATRQIDYRIVSKRVSRLVLKSQNTRWQIDQGKKEKIGPFTCCNR